MVSDAIKKLAMRYVPPKEKRAWQNKLSERSQNYNQRTPYDVSEYSTLEKVGADILNQHTRTWVLFNIRSQLKRVEQN